MSAAALGGLSAASAAASEGVSCAELARPVRIAAHPLGGLGAVAGAIAARSSEDTEPFEPFSLDAAPELFSRRFPTSPSPPSSAEARLPRARRAETSSPRACLAPSVSFRPRSFFPLTVSHSPSSNDSTVTVDTCRASELASEATELASEPREASGGGSEEVSDAPSDLRVFSETETDEPSRATTSDLKLLKESLSFPRSARTSDVVSAPDNATTSVAASRHAAVAAGESFFSPRTRRALTRAGSFSIFSPRRGALFHALFAGTGADDDTSSPRRSARSGTDAMCAGREDRRGSESSSSSSRETKRNETEEEAIRQFRKNERIYTNARLDARSQNS